MGNSIEIDSRKKIIIAEDDSTFAILLKYRLEVDGFSTYLANDGYEALKLINEIKPDLFISDIMLPNISGLEILEQIKLNNSLNFPTLIMSAAGQETMVNKAFELGASGFLNKPFTINELLIRVNQIMNHFDKELLEIKN